MGPVERVGVFGGTFDPPHAGHVAVVRAILSERLCDRVLLVPAGSPWQKEGRSDLSDAQDRVAMVRLAFAGVRGSHVSRIEVDREGPSYMVDTLRTIGAENPGAELCLVLGADAAAGLQTWHEWAELARLARMVVVARPDTGSDAHLVADDLSPYGRADVLEMPPVPASSTDLRRRIGAGERNIEGLDRSVEEYAVRNALYGA